MIEVIIGLFLIINGIISIIICGPANITHNIFGISTTNLIWIGHFFMAIRILLGFAFIFFYNKIENYLLFIGLYFILDGAFSIFEARDFNSWDDFMRIILIGIGLCYFLRQFLF